MNTLYFGDNLEVMREMGDQCVDLICTDPPFNSGRDYNAFLTGSLAQSKAFTDTWTWDNPAQDSRADIERRARTSDTYKALDNCLKGYDLVLQNAVSGNKGAMRAYLAFMGLRLAEMHRLLKDTGSIYLHCDPTASHYLKCIMDAVFDEDNFRNEIVWQRTNAHNDGKQYGRVHDTILFYSKSKRRVWNPIYTEHDPGYIKKFYRHSDERGLYRIGDLHAPGVTQEGESGKPWKGINPSDVGRHWSVPRREAWPEGVEAPEDYETLSVHKKLDALDANGLIYWPPKGKVPQFKRYLSTSKGTRVHDIIIDIYPLASNSKEKLGYPTQKPLALYERMIKASSNEGDLVMDPFAGCGTTIDAAHTLNRFWIGIDLTILSLDPMRRRLADRHGLQPSRDYEIHGYPTNMQEVHMLVRDERKYHDFSNWAVTRLGLQPTKSVGDGGKDGEAHVGHITLWDPDAAETTNTRILAEVKSGKPTISQVRAFCRVMDKNDAIGVFITIEPVSAGMRQEAADMGTFTHNNETFPRLQFWQIDDAYFQDPSSLRNLIRLPQQWLEPMRKMERHFTDAQMNFNLRGDTN